MLASEIKKILIIGVSILIVMVMTIFVMQVPMEHWENPTEIKPKENISIVEVKEEEKEITKKTKGGKGLYFIGAGLLLIVLYHFFGK